jgi:hypothetical protein
MATIDTTAKLDQSKVIAFLSERWRNKNCPICQSINWGINDDLAELRFLSIAGFHIGGPVIPLVVLTCTVCGHTLLFNAIRMGWTAPAEGATGETK